MAKHIVNSLLKRTPSLAKDGMMIGCLFDNVFIIIVSTQLALTNLFSGRPMELHSGRTLDSSSEGQRFESSNLFEVLMDRGLIYLPKHFGEIVQSRRRKSVSFKISSSWQLIIL